MAKKTASSVKGAESAPAPQSFEAALHRLEEIVTQLERAEAPLEKALALYEEGVKLSRFCASQLKDAERRVEVLEDKNGELRGRPYAGEGQPAAGEDAPGEACGTKDSEDEDKDDDGDDDGEKAPSLF